MFKLSRSEQLTILFLVGVILVGGAVASVRKYLENKERGHLLIAESVVASREEAAPKEIIIHITGAVKKPGIYHFKEGARVIKAIEAAGGPEEGALLDILNLAQPMKDGSKIVVSRKFTVEEFKRRSVSYAKRERKKPKIEKRPQPMMRININRASKEELEKFLRLKPQAAIAIIKYRQKHGLFHEISEIKKARWIGRRKYKKLKDRITVD